MDPTNPLHLILTIIAALALLALIIGIIVFLVKPSSRRDSFRLAVPLHLVSRKNKKNHVFLGISEYSRLLAAQIIQEWKKEKNKKDQGRILFVDLADTFSPTAEQQLKELLGSKRVMVLNGSLRALDVPSLAQSIGLDGLQPWLENARTSLYLFSDKLPENARLLSLATDDSSIRAKVFYYASVPDGYDSLVASTGIRVRMLNPHQMSFMHLKLDCPDQMPHNFVRKALDKEGNPLGYVEDGLHALVVGFGHTGQEAVRFLVEYGSFVGKDYLRAPMSIRVYDPQLQRKLGSFLQSAPALKGDPAFLWNADCAGSAGFWEAFERDADTNYIVIAIDDGSKNLQLGVSMLQAAARAGRDVSKMLILIRDWKDTRKSREIMAYYNAAYCPEGVQVLRSFGSTREIWTPDVISGRRLKDTAKLFYENQKTMGVSEDWDARRERLSKPGAGQLQNQQELRRRQAMDISRALYAPTLLSFAPTAGDPDAARMEYLLAQEHLHWKNALELIGYTDGPLDELNKKHPGLVPYPDITDERNRSMGELAVKSMLALREK